MIENGEIQWTKRLKAHDKVNGKRYHPFIYFITNMLVDGKAPVIVFVGEQGNGKSMKALECARILHNDIGICAGDYTPERVKANQLYEVKEFNRRLMHSKRQALIFDEAGINLNSKDHRTAFNRSVDNVIQTQRYKQNVLMFVLPKFRDIDKKIRESCNVRVHVYKKGLAKVTKFKYLFEQDGSFNKTRRQITFRKQWRPNLPPKDLVDAYREKELEFKDNLPDSNIKKIEEKEREKKRITL